MVKIYKYIYVCTNTYIIFFYKIIAIRVYRVKWEGGIGLGRGGAKGEVVTSELSNTVDLDTALKK